MLAPSPPSSTSSSPAARAFARAARSIRARLAAREIWRGLLLGSALCCGVWCGRWALGAQWPAWTLALLPLAGATLGAMRARRRRWDDADIAGYLDARLELPESLLSWLHLPADPSLEREAHSILQHRRALPAPRAWTPTLLAGSAGVALLALGASQLLPVRTPSAVQAGATELARLAPSLAALEGLRDLPARDDAERERRLALVAEAKELDAALRRGLSREQAQARLGALRDQLAEEHANLGGSNAGSGLDAAARALAGRGEKTLAEALANRDLVAFDQELERLAAAREKSDRASARRALDEAAAAARAAGAAAVASMLDQSAAAVAERGKRNDALRAFAEAIRDAGAGSEELAQAAERLDRKGSAEAAEAAAEAMAKALAALTDEQRARLAKNLAAMRAQSGGASPPPPAGANALDAEALARELRELASAELTVQEAERDRAYRDSERNLDQAGNELRGALPDGPGGAAQAGAGTAPGSGGQGGPAQGGPSQGGPSQGGGGGSHDGATGEVAAAELRARARTHAGAGSQGAHLTVTGPGGAGELPLRSGVEPSAAGRARELSHLDDGELPAEYREQVRRYFSP